MRRLWATLPLSNLTQNADKLAMIAPLESISAPPSLIPQESSMASAILQQVYRIVEAFMTLCGPHNGWEANAHFYCGDSRCEHYFAKRNRRAKIGSRKTSRHKAGDIDERTKRNHYSWPDYARSTGVAIALIGQKTAHLR
jgi:hypothetical protein